MILSVVSWLFIATVACAVLAAVLVLALYVKFSRTPRGTRVVSTGHAHHGVVAQPAVRVAHAIATGALSSAAATASAIARLTAVNPTLNAVVATRFDLARAEAAAVDALPASAKAKLRLCGVPMTVKEAIGVAGMPNASGLVARQHVRAAQDATVVKRLREHGVVVLGVTNTSELCMWQESYNRLYGLTSNPHDTSRTVGGSSGGEAAAVAAGISMIGVGSDIGGSIRMPAFFCGLFGHKPSGGAIPNSGQFPIASGRALRYLTTGPITRHASDLWPMFEIMAGPDGHDPMCREMRFGDPHQLDVSKLTVYVVTGINIPGMRVAQSLLDAQERAASAFERAGARVVRDHALDLSMSVDIWATLLADAGGTTFRQHMNNDHKGEREAPARLDRVWHYVLDRLGLGDSPHTLPALGLTAIERLQNLPMAEARKPAIRERARALKRELEGMLGAFDETARALKAPAHGQSILLFPPHTQPAPRHCVPLFFPIQWVMTAIWNSMELPSTQVPLGHDAHGGLPVGVQVIAGEGGDHLTIGAALFLERELGGWTEIEAWRD
jgi:fatty acid amide hydrolase 2